MEKLNIFVSVPVLESDIQKIKAVDPRVNVTYGMEEVRTELGIARDSILALKNSARQRDITPAEASATLDKVLPNVEVIFGWRLPKNIQTRAPHLKWLQASAVGIDLLLSGSTLMQSDVVITNASGVNTVAVAETAVGFLYMLSKKSAALETLKAAHKWEAMFFTELRGTTLGIVGLGKIGAEVARVAKTIGMKVITATRLEDNPTGVDEVYPPEQLHKMLSKADYVLVTVPQTPQTAGLMDEAAFKAMKKSAFFINVSRGGIVQEAWLIKALKEKWIAGAALDVFEKEPLPKDNELWDIPNVIISPHIAGVLENHMSLATDLFCENLKHYLKKEPLINVFNKARGY